MRWSANRNRWLFRLGVAGLVPALYFASLAPNDSLPEALGCSGGEPSEYDGPTGVAELHQPNWPVAIDNSGFFAFAVGTRNIEPDAALEALTIDVRDALRQPVAGKALVLDHETGGPFEFDTVWIGWQADQSLELEDRLTFTATATNAEETISMSGKLVASGPAPVLGEPEASFQPWVKATVDTGEIFECDECAAFGVDLETRYRSLVDIAGSQPDLNVAWKYSVEAIRDKGELVEGSTVYVTSPGSSPSDVGIAVDFTDQRDEYCVRVTAQDLRSGEEHSSEACSSPEALPESASDSIIRCHIDQVPEALRKRYCSYEEYRDDERCAPYVEEPEPPVGTGGGATGGKNTGGSTGGVEEGTTGGAPPDDAAPHETPRRKSKSGCSFDGVPPHEPVIATLAGLGLLAFAVARRRQGR